MSKKPPNHSEKPNNYGVNLLNIRNITKHPNKWRSAFAAIISSRELVSLAKEIRARSPSDTTVDIHQLNYAWSNVDPKKLSDIVKEKNLPLFQEDFGGIERLVNVLQTDLDNGINDDAEEINHRRNLLGSNTYHKSPPKRIVHFVVEAFKDFIILILLVCGTLALAFGIKNHGWEKGWYEAVSIFVAIFLVVAASPIIYYNRFLGCSYPTPPHV